MESNNINAKESSLNWFLGIKLDNFSDNPEDKIENIDFYNNYNNQVFAHFNLSHNKNSGKFKFDVYMKDNFEHWKSLCDIIIPLKKEKFDQIREINTTNHKSKKKFLKAFGFEEYII